MGGPAPPELVHILEEWRVGPERGQGFEQHCPVALLPEHRRGKGFDRAVLVQEPRRRDRADPRNARIAVGRVAHEREEVGDQLGLHAELLAHPLYYVIARHTEMSRSGLDHLQYRMQHAADGAEALILAIAEMAPAVKLAEQLVRAVDEMNDHAAASGRRSRSARRQPAHSRRR